ncbi:hypothetical protein WJ60_06910 [Burkholderia ubonensis]|uniref:LysR family transcriptional regulator n=1 Tax=Burkholderia ubonensis TaxID=101571 RepID=UPI000757D495|nr:LysR family transcriptional regulator [Burkholderia ubonensis]KVM72751.1 hypothetical protein WJ60_06910 [Burkholderia ubonensis]
MNFTHLAEFYAVVETGSVTAASERLHVSQPALTREIWELEERLGATLFDRLPRGMQPTEAGRLLADYAAQIFSLANAAEAAVGEFADLTRGQLGIGSSRTIGVYLLPAMLNEFRIRYPGITVDLRISNSENIESAVLANERQIGMIEGPYDSAAFDAAVIGRDTLIPVAAPPPSPHTQASVDFQCLIEEVLLCHKRKTCLARPQHGHCPSRASKW